MILHRCPSRCLRILLDTSVMNGVVIHAVPENKNVRPHQIIWENCDAAPASDWQDHYNWRSRAAAAPAPSGGGCNSTRPSSTRTPTTSCGADLGWPSNDETARRPPAEAPGWPSDGAEARALNRPPQQPSAASNPPSTGHGDSSRATAEVTTR